MHPRAGEPNDAGSVALAASAQRTAQSAAERAGVTVRTLHTIDDLEQARAVFDATWPLPGGGTTMESNLIRALEHSGAYVSAAFDAAGPPGSPAVGATLAFLGRHRDRDGAWETHLHSHMTAALPGWQDRHVGTALKLHQRAWSLRHDVPVVVWTFDPLVRRNARFNLVKLGAGVAEYLPDFYGTMTDEVNAGDHSDRLLVWWDVASPQAQEAAAGALRAISDLPHEAVVVPLPDDVVALRRSDRDAALRWRLQVREAMAPRIAAGWAVHGITPDGAYVLVPPHAGGAGPQEVR
jgi:predicted GNAT superfamily acetyltransferase